MDWLFPCKHTIWQRRCPFPRICVDTGAKRRIKYSLVYYSNWRLLFHIHIFGVPGKCFYPLGISDKRWMWWCWVMQKGKWGMYQKGCAIIAIELAVERYRVSLLPVQSKSTRPRAIRPSSGNVYFCLYLDWVPLFVATVAYKMKPGSNEMIVVVQSTLDTFRHGWYFQHWR